MIQLCEGLPSPKDLSSREMLSYSVYQNTEHCHSFIQESNKVSSRHKRLDGKFTVLPSRSSVSSGGRQVHISTLMINHDSSVLEVQ